MDWAIAHERIVFTHDLDFGTMLALTHAAGPSVLQVRAENILPDYLAGSVIAALNQHEADLSSGALVVVDESRSRVRVLTDMKPSALEHNSAHATAIIREICDDRDYSRKVLLLIKANWY